VSVAELCVTNTIYLFSHYPLRIPAIFVILVKLAKKQPQAEIAQLVEQRTENPRVRGSSPRLGIMYIRTLNVAIRRLVSLNSKLLTIRRLVSLLIVGNDPVQVTARKFWTIYGIYVLYLDRVLVMVDC
jgi:hypothetical protein